MKTLASELAYFFRGRVRRNVKWLVVYMLFLIGLVILYAFLFRHFMRTLEGRDYSFIGSLYWTITAMTTLGFGDITFTTDQGHLFSIIVTLSGVLFILIILPFGAISLFLGPWLEDRLKFHPRLALPEDVAGHVIICGWDPVTRTLAASLRAATNPYVLIEADYESAARLDEEGIDVVYGIPTDRDVLERVRVKNASAVVANLSDTDNANLLLTVRSMSATPVLVLVTEAERVGILQAAGAREAVALREVLGGYLAVRATTRGSTAHVVDSLGDLLFAEIPAHGTPFVGRTLAETTIRETTGASVIGVWERGRFSLPSPATAIAPGMVFLLAGSRPSLERLEKMTKKAPANDLVIVVGYGTVGRATASYLARDRVPHVLIDRNFHKTGPDSPVATSGRRLVDGDASRRAVLEEAGIREAGGLVITTNDDGTNVFLTLACRQLNPDLRIVSRANREENVDELYAAGADFVVSLASIGASTLINAIQGRRTIFLTEGVHIFWQTVPPMLVGRTLANSQIRHLTGATVIAVQEGDRQPELDVGPNTTLRQGDTLLMVGSPASETAFVERFHE